MGGLYASTFWMGQSAAFREVLVGSAALMACGLWRVKARTMGDPLVTYQFGPVLFCGKSAADGSTEPNPRFAKGGGPAIIPNNDFGSSESSM